MLIPLPLLLCTVWVKVGICTADSLINIALCCLGYIPGLVHAWYIIFKYPEDLEDPNYSRLAQDDGSHVPGRSGGRGRVISRDAENGRVTYYYISPPQQRRQQPPHEQGYQQPEPAYADGRRASQVQDGGVGVVPQGQRSYGTVDTQAPGASSSNGVDEEFDGDRRPPTYAEAVRGDHKIQHWLGVGEGRWNIDIWRMSFSSSFFLFPIFLILFWSGCWYLLQCWNRHDSWIYPDLLSSAIFSPFFTHSHHKKQRVNSTPSLTMLMTSTLFCFACL